MLIDPDLFDYQQTPCPSTQLQALKSKFQLHYMQTCQPNAAPSYISLSFFPPKQFLKC
jgi:hypothetical protein